MIFRPIADAKADQAAEIAQALVLEGAVEGEFEAPEDQGRDDAHAGIEDEGLQIVRRVLGLEAEDEDLVEQVLQHQADRRADQHRELDLPRAGPDADGERLGQKVRGRRDQGDDRVDDRKPHRLTFSMLPAPSITTGGG